MTAYYNEFDPHAAQWLRNAIDAEIIASGHVDNRSIVDVTPDDLRGYTQHHFFAGIGIWSIALRIAGWGDDRPVFTGSCPCQPFSEAGKGKGKEDERHLWPVFFRLIDAVRPDWVFGEQVPAAIKHGWLDDLCDDMEGSGYATWAIDLPACSIGSPTIRQRLWWGASRVSCPEDKRTSGASQAWQSHVERRGTDGGLRDSESHDERRKRKLREDGRPEWEIGRSSIDGHGGLCLPNGAGRSEGQPSATTTRHGGSTDPTSRFSPDGCDWLAFLDKKTRPIERGLECLVDGPAFVLANGSTSREGQSRAKILKAIGNAIVPDVAAEFIRLSMTGGAA